MKILLVEDEPAIASAIKKVLENQNYNVEIASNGDDGLTLILRNSYHLVILDRMLPGKYDGIGILRHMRKSKIYMPVLMLTGMGTKENIVEGLANGADDYMVKPFSITELSARIEALLRRSYEYDVIDTI